MFSSETAVSVRYAETDAMAIVHHANYIVWFEQGRTDFFEWLGYPYPEIESQGFLLPVLDVQANYIKSFRYGDKALIKTSLVEYNRLRMTFKYEIFNNQNELCVKGNTTHVMVKKSNFHPVNLSKTHPELHDTFMKALM